MNATVSTNVAAVTFEDEETTFESKTLYIVCEVFNCLLVFITLYIFACMVVYGLKTGKWKSSGRSSDVNGGVVYTAAIVAVAMTFPRYVVDQVMFNAVFIKGALPYCEVIMDIANATYFVAVYPVYLFLWLRQKALYGHPAMRRLAGKCVAALSWVILVGLSMAAVGVGLEFTVPNDYTYNQNGCVLKQTSANESSSNGIAYGSYYGLAALLVVAQLSVVGLFIYPMLRSNAIQNERKASKQLSKGNLSLNTDSNDSTSFRQRSWITTIRQASRKLSTSSNGKSNTVQKTIRRSVFCAVLSMATDLIATAVVTFAVAETVPRFLTNTIYDIATLQSVLCVLGSFESYRNILTVFCVGKGTSSTPLKTSNSVEDSHGYSGKFHSVSNHDSSV